MHRQCAILGRYQVCVAVVMMIVSMCTLSMLMVVNMLCEFLIANMFQHSFCVVTLFCLTFIMLFACTAKGLVLFVLYIQNIQINKINIIETANDSVCVLSIFAFFVSLLLQQLSSLKFRNSKLFWSLFRCIPSRSLTTYNSLLGTMFERLGIFIQIATMLKGTSQTNFKVV